MIFKLEIRTCIVFHKQHNFFCNRSLPTLVELFGYIFYFGGVFLGPGFFYRDYQDFIEGTNLLPEEKKGRNGVLNDLHKPETSGIFYVQVHTFFSLFTQIET